MLYMAKFKEKIEAHKLRRSGESIGAIAQKLGIAKSTVSLWCREIELTAKQQKKLDQKIIESGQSGRSLGASVNKRKREVIITRANEKGDRLIKKISKRDLLFLGLGLYWGEGSKNTENRFILVNSDPFIIKAVIKWLKEVMSIPRELLTLQIYINEQHEYRRNSTYPSHNSEGPCLFILHIKRYMRITKRIWGYCISMSRKVQH